MSAIPWTLIGAVSFTMIAASVGGFWFWFLLIRKKKQIWIANVYQLGEGIKPPVRNKGETIANYRLCDLREYTKDIIHKKIDKSGAEYYMLKKLGKSVPQVTADCVQVWGPKEKIVNVLIHEGTCTLLKNSYERKLGEQLFIPMPHSRTNMIKMEVRDRKERMDEKAGVAQHIATWIVTGLWILGMICIVYFFMNGFVKVSDNLLATQRDSAKAIESVGQVLREIEAYRLYGEAGANRPLPSYLNNTG